MKKPAHVVGMMVTALVVFGTDLDVMMAVPLGVFAGALMTFIVALDDARRDARPAPVKPSV